MRTRALVFRKNECFTRERGNRTGGLWERCTAWYARSRRSLPNRPMPPLICPRPRISAARRTFIVCPSRADSRYPADEWWGGKTRWQSAVRVLAVGRVVGSKIVVPPTITRYMAKARARWNESEREPPESERGRYETDNALNVLLSFRLSGTVTLRPLRAATGVRDGRKQLRVTTGNRFAKS